MAAATTTTISQLTAFIECSVCFEIFNDPRVLPCQHSFCLRCLQGTWASKQPKDTVNCPLCRERFVIPEEGVCGIRKDHRVNALMDVYDLKTANNSQFCGEHKGKALDLYCRSCKTAVCSSCLIKDHSGHSVSEVREFLDETRKQMSNELIKLSEYEKQMNEKKIWLGKNDNKFLLEIDTTENSINIRAEKLKQLIEQQRLSLIEELCIIKQKQLKEITKDREEMENHSAEIESMKYLCNAIALTENPVEISKTMTAFRTTSDKLAENHQVQLERQLLSAKVSFQPTDPEEDQERKIGSITAVAMRLMKKLDTEQYTHCNGMTKLANNIYVLRRELIEVYEDQSPFPLEAEIHLKEIGISQDIASSGKLKCLYVTDSVNNCIWKIRVDDHRVTKWLSDVEEPFALSVNSDDHILKLRDGGHTSQLEIYGSDANIIRILPLSSDIQWPLHAVQKPSGQFIISHRATTGCSGPWVVSQLTNDGKTVSRFYPKDKSQYHGCPWHLALDLEKGKVLLANRSEKGIILLDSISFNCIEIHLTLEEIEYNRLQRIHYDASKKQLFIGMYKYGIFIYELNEIGA